MVCLEFEPWMQDARHRWNHGAMTPAQKLENNNVDYWAVVVAQLAEQSLPIPEDPGSNPVIGNFY